MRASILGVGTELLFGQTVNTNAAFLSKQLNLMGFDVMYHFVVGDNPGRLAKTLKLALAETDLVVTTGGLGPTQDDLTKETIAEVFGAALLPDERAMREMREFFIGRGRKMPENNLKQGYLPAGSTVFYNKRGTAPGFAIEKDGKCAIAFPGPPYEMEWMFENRTRAFLEKFIEKKMYYVVVRTIGIGESDLETRLLPLIDGQVDPTIATYAKQGECTMRIASQRDDLDEAKATVDDMLKKVNSLVGEYIYSYDDTELSEVVVEKLKKARLKLASAESCTGGKFAAAVTDIAGASDIYERGFVTYSPEAKIDDISVKAETIESYGVVSSEVAIEMAEGARLKAGADMAVSVTGFAGPSGGAGEGDEPGKAYIGYSTPSAKGSFLIRTKRDDRGWNRQYFVLNMFRILNDILDGDI